MPRASLTLRREDGRVVAEAVEVCGNAPGRMKGLLGRKSLASGEGVVLRPAWSIHTWFMRFPIDVVFVDPDQVVIKIDEAVPPFRTSTCRGAREVVELAAGECARRGLEVGDRVAWAARASWVDAPSTESALAGFGTHERHGTVVLASADQRFLKLARFLLEGRNLEVVDTVAPSEGAEAIGERRPDVVVLDAGTDVAAGLRMMNAVKAHAPGSSVVVVGEETEGRSPVAVPVLDKWSESERIVEAVEAATAGR